MTHAALWLDGDVVPWGQAQVSVLSHALQRGAAVFDVGALHEAAATATATATPAPRRRALLFRATDHIARFLRSAALVGLEVPWTAEALLDATRRTACASGLMSALVRWTAFVPGLEPDVVPRPGTRASVAIAVITAEDALRPGETLAAKPSLASGVRVSIPREARKAGPEVFPPQAKVSASYLGPMLAKRRAVAEGFDEVVLLDGDGRVAEAPTANVFAVKGGAIVTPPTERVLAGITRDSVLAIARAEGIPAREAHLSPDDLADADEAFLTATSFPVRAIGSIDGRALRGGAPGPVTTHLEAVLLACERGEDPRFASWVLEAGV